jgi:WD40 repeat protein/DNA-binding SARP family transcriptional activator
MRISILGHVEASVDDQPVTLGGAKQRAVLAMLGLEANRPVTADRLAEGLWGEHPPQSAGKMVQNYVWRLRQTFADDGGAEIVTRGSGYELRIDRELVDVCRLERLVSEAARAAENGRANGAAREALALFRGDPLADVADEPFASAEIRRIEELRLTAAELAIDADLAAGRHQEVVGEIDALLSGNPLRERLHGQRMLALYRCGRQAEALDAYREARQTLVEEIGIEPSPELRRLHDAILRQDPSLDVASAVPELPPELETAAASPILGRDEELRRLRDHWQHAAAGAGALVVLAGAYGIGKTRVAAEVAGAVYREGAPVLYAGGSGPPQAVLVAMARARASRTPVLVVVDDADRAGAEVRGALGALAAELAHLPVLLLCTGEALAGLPAHDTLVLGPLEPQAVGAIAAFYAPAGAAGAVPVESLLAASRGVPLRVHEAASEWARHEAARRVEGAAGRAAIGRTQARALSAELAGSVADLQWVNERTAERSEETAAVCPYKGLATFGAEDAEYFFGREQLVADLVAHLVGAPLLAIVGPSGSGKSSALRAGLLPALAGGVLPGSAGWTQALIRPGEHPLRELRGATRRLAREARSVLAIDQFEELFTVCADEEERAEFVAGLARVARDRSGRCVVVLAVRADMYGRCAAYPDLSALLGANHVLVGPMARDELRRAIERPAQRVGLAVEPGLVEALLADVEGRAGALPLLSTTLLELWGRRDGSTLRLAEYVRRGGVQGAVARLAEDAYLRLDAAQQIEARALMLRLADEDEDGAIVRRRIPLAELDAGAHAVATELADRRLLTVSDGAVEVAHEALLREWPRLRAWLDEDVQGRQLHRRLADAARAWDADDRDSGGLYRGARLAAALDWAAAHQPELNATERAFLDAGRHAAGRAQRRLRMVLAGVAALLVLAVIAGVVALDQRARARDEATTAAAQRLGAQALAEGDLDKSLLLARQGVAIDDTLQTRSNLLAALLKSPAAIGVLSGDGGRVTGLDISPDDRTLAFVDADGTLTRVDTRTRKPIARPLTVPGHLMGWGPDDVRFSRDGTRLSVGGSEPVVLDTRSGRVATAIPPTEGVLYGARFAPDGRTLFVVLDHASNTTFVQRIDARTGARLTAPRYVARDPATVTVLVTHDAERVVTTFDQGPTVIRDGRTLRPLRRIAIGGETAALAPDDRTVLLGRRDGSVRFVDLVTGRIRAASGRHDGPVTAAAFAPDGRTAVTAGEDSRAIVWDVAHAKPRETLTGHSGVVTAVIVSHDGRTAYTAGQDGKVVIWDLAGDRRLGRPFDTAPAFPLSYPLPPFASYALARDGRTLAVGHGDGTVSLLDARTLRERSTFPAVRKGPVFGMGFLPGGPLLAVGGADGFLGLFDAGSGRLVRRLSGHTWPVHPPSISADGRSMATVSASSVQLWTLRSGRPVGPPRKYPSSPNGTIDAALSPDGRTLAVASPLGVDVVDVAKLQRRPTIPTVPGLASSVRFSPDGRTVAIGRPEGYAEVLSTRTWRPVARRFAGHTGEVTSVAISPNGRTLATGSWDGTIWLYDIATGQPLGTPLRAVLNHTVEPFFSPDGAYLYAITDAGTSYRWDVRPSTWERLACSVAGRSLTRTEWDNLLPGRDYSPAC